MEASKTIAITLEGQIAKLEDLLNLSQTTQPNLSRCLRNRQTERANGIQNLRVESKRVDEFANMSDEELRQYVYGNKEGISFG